MMDHKIYYVTYLQKESNFGKFVPMGLTSTPSYTKWYRWVDDLAEVDNLKNENDIKDVKVYESICKLIDGV